MSELRLPDVPEVIGNNVIVKKEVWDALVRYLVTVQNTVNAQAAAIESIERRVSQSEKNNAELAKAVLGGLYNEA